MKTWMRNRPLAILILAVVIVAAIPLSCIRTVSSLASKCEKLYTAGTDRYGTPGEDVSRALDYAAQLAAVAASQGCAGSLTEKIEAARAAALPLGEDALTPVFTEAAMVYNQLMALPELGDAQKNSAISLYHEIDSTRMRLEGNEPYADAAKRYNEAIAAFPASLFSAGRTKAVEF